MRDSWLKSKVYEGSGDGRKLGFPTVNLDPGVMRSWKKGVYSARVRYNGAEYAGVLYYGPRTVKHEKNDVVEIHIIGFEKRIYGSEIRFKPGAFIRPVMSFSSMDELKEQIKKDTVRAHEILTQA